MKVKSRTKYKKKKRVEVSDIEKELLQTALAEELLIKFVEQAWKVVEPATPFKSNWHIEAICEHMQAVSKREIKRLLINVPPRHMKSLTVAVFFPAWEWIHNPEVKFLYSTYAQDLTIRDSVKCRRLIQSEWYQMWWSERFSLTSDQNQKTRFENDKTGYRLATSVSGMATGEGGNHIIVDDAHNVKEAESDLKRNEVLLWWDEVMPSRLNDPENDTKTICMQRTHSQDLAGHVLEKELGYTHLMLPAEFEKDRKCIFEVPVRLSNGSVIYEDPRTEDDEPLWKNHYGHAQLEKLKKEMRSIYAVAGQLQQRPAPRGGGMFKIEKMKIINELPHDIIRSVRYWDKAGTEGGGCFTAGVLIHKLRDRSYLIADVVYGQWSAGNRELRIKQVAEMDTKKTRIWIEQEPGSGGKESAENTIRNLAGWCCKADKVTGSKEVRAEPYADQVEIGNVKVLNRQWTEELIQEHEAFPVGKLKDIVDAAAGAFNKISVQRVAGVMGAS